MENGQGRLLQTDAANAAATSALDALNLTIAVARKAVAVVKGRRALLKGKAIAQNDAPCHNV